MNINFKTPKAINVYVFILLAINSSLYGQQPPIITCQNVNVYLNPSGEGFFDVNNPPVLVFYAAAYPLTITSEAFEFPPGDPILPNFDCADVLAPQYTFYFRATVMDNNGLSTNCFGDIMVFDTIAPIAICKGSVSVEVPYNPGMAAINASFFDDGSFDNCGGILEFKVRRLTYSCNQGNNTFQDEVIFCCQDVGQIIPIQLRVTDIHGKSSTCFSNVSVEGCIGPSFAINNNYYTTLEDALAAAQVNDVIMLMDDFVQSNNLTIPLGITLWIPEPYIFDVDGATLTNNGQIVNNNVMNLFNGAMLINNGQYTGSGTFNGTFQNNGSISPGN